MPPHAMKPASRAITFVIFLPTFYFNPPSCWARNTERLYSNAVLPTLTHDSFSNLPSTFTVPFSYPGDVVGELLSSGRRSFGMLTQTASLRHSTHKGRSFYGVGPQYSQLKLKFHLSCCTY